MVQREAVNLLQTRKLVGRGSLDVLGFEQATAILNEFNYRPRPVIQSYSAFTPYLAKLNGDFYASDKAPDYILLKVQAIDYRMPMMDDPEVWRIVSHRYDFVHRELGYQLWKRLPGKYDPASAAPQPLKNATLAVGDTLPLDAYAGKQLWIRLVLPQTLIGRLHAFLYKPPHVTLVVKDNAGTESEFYMPLSQGRAGFILSPIIEDAIAYVAFANGRPGREVRSIRLKIKPGDRLLFADEAQVELSELKPAHTGDRFYSNVNQDTFHMFKSYPIQYEAHVPVSENTLDGHQLIVLHAPSEMIFNMPANATEVSGMFGFVPGAYTSGGNTNGAEFVVYWSNGSQNVELFRRFLDPVHNTGDRGLQSFKVSLASVSGGRLYLRIEPGPYGNFAWDWTGWTGIDIH